MCPSRLIRNLAGNPGLIMVAYTVYDTSVFVFQEYRPVDMIRGGVTLRNMYFQSIISFTDIDTRISLSTHVLPHYRDSGRLNSPL